MSFCYLQRNGELTKKLTDLQKTVEQLIKSLELCKTEAKQHIEASLRLDPGEEVPTYFREPEWVVLEDIRDIAHNALVSISKK